MTQEQYEAFVNELELKGYKAWKDTFRHGEISYYKHWYEDKEHNNLMYTIAFRHWDFSQYSNNNEHLKEHPHSFDISIRFTPRVCELELSYPDVCSSIEHAELAASKLYKQMSKLLNLKY